MSIGRPTTGTLIDARIPQPVLDQLNHLAEINGVDRAEIIRRALAEWTDTNGAAAIQIRDTHGEWQTTRQETITRERAEGADPGILAARLGAYDEEEGRSLMAVDSDEWRVDVTWLGAWTGAELEEGARERAEFARRHSGPFSSGCASRVSGKAPVKPAQEPLEDWERELLEGGA